MHSNPECRIQCWRQDFRRYRVFAWNDVEELEEHLRETVAAARAQGIPLANAVSGSHRAADRLCRKHPRVLRKRSRKTVPTIARFYGIVIKMYFRDHGTPHFHALYAEHHGVFDISTLEMIEGDLPRRARRLVREWAETYRSDLKSMWETQEFRKLPGLDP